MRKWVHGPFGPDAMSGQTVRSQRTVLVVVHSLAPMPCALLGFSQFRQSGLALPPVRAGLPAAGE
jgi:hypothetical protein